MFRQIFEASVRVPQNHKHTRILVEYNEKGKMIRGTYDIPEGRYPTMVVPGFEFEAIIRELKMNERKVMTDAERKASQQAATTRYRKKKQEARAAARASGVIPPKNLIDGRTYIDASGVQEIRRLSRLGWRNCDIAKHVGLSDSTISRILSGKRRKNVA